MIDLELLIREQLEYVLPRQPVKEDWDNVIARAGLASSPTASPPPARFSDRRVRRLVPVAIGFGLLVVVAAGVAVLVTQGHGRPRLASTTRPRTSGLPSSAVITARVLLALSENSNDISHVTTALPIGHMESWIDREIGTTRNVFFDSSGSVTQEIVETYSRGTVRTDDVRYSEHLWFDLDPRRSRCPADREQPR